MDVSVVWHGCVDCGMVVWSVAWLCGVWNGVVMCGVVWMCGCVEWCVFPVCVVVDVCTHTWVVCAHIHNGKRLSLSDSITESAFMYMH